MNPACARRRERRLDLFGRVDAPHPAQQARVEALRAHAQAVDAGRAQGIKPPVFQRVPGLASSVISASASTAKASRAASSSRSTGAAVSRLGVPPPKKMVRQRRGCHPPARALSREQDLSRQRGHISLSRWPSMPA